MKCFIYLFVLLAARCASTEQQGKIVELEEAQFSNQGNEEPKSIDKIEKIYEDESQNPLVDVFVSEDEIFAPLQGVAVLPCEYYECPESSEKGKVTWKVGNGPRQATHVATCEGYDEETGSCDQFHVNDPDFLGRVGMFATDTPALTLSGVSETDNRNFWCQVQLGNKDEFGTDMKSVVLRVRDSSDERPKFNRISLQTNLIKTSVGETVTFGCSCSGYHCDDVSWYKGPTNEWGSNYVDIYTKKTKFNAKPVITINEEWEDRINVEGYQMTLSGIQSSDNGRYWCEASGADYYSLGDTATDAKSVVLIVTDDPSSSYNCD